MFSTAAFRSLIEVSCEEYEPDSGWFILCIYDEDEDDEDWFSVNESWFAVKPDDNSEPWLSAVNLSDSPLPIVELSNWRKGFPKTKYSKV